MEFPLNDNSPSPGAQHGSIEEAMEDAEADGTKSILDIERIGKTLDFGVAAPLDEEYLEELYSTTEPTHEMIELNMDFFKELERGHGIYIIVNRDGKPNEIFFAGYSYD